MNQDREGENLHVKIARLETRQEHICSKIEKIETWMTRAVFLLIATGAGVLVDIFTG